MFMIFAELKEIFAKFTKNMDIAFLQTPILCKNIDRLDVVKLHSGFIK